MPHSIVSDRGSNWTGRFWRRFCVLAGIKQRLSTAYHPQTDGGPERTNQEIEAYLRAYISFLQGDWGRWIPTAQLALNGRESTAIKMSPFFVQHGYHIEPFAVAEGVGEPVDSTAAAADKLLERTHEVTEYIQAAAAATQQRNEEAANVRRYPSERFEVGDKVWLSMANYRSPRPCKKLDWLHHKYTVTKVISSHVVELDVPGAIHPRFHVDLLRRAPQDPAPGQEQDDFQPPPVQNDEGGDEWEVEEILCARTKRRGRGERREALVRWRGYAEPTWEPVAFLEDTVALEEFERRYGPVSTADGPRESYEAPARRRRGAGEAPGTGEGCNVTG